jgi:hypothetical protein
MLKVLHALYGDGYVVERQGHGWVGVYAGSDSYGHTGPHILKLVWYVTKEEAINDCATSTTSFELDAAAQAELREISRLTKNHHDGLQRTHHDDYSCNIFGRHYSKPASKPTTKQEVLSEFSQFITASMNELKKHSQ